MNPNQIHIIVMAFRQPPCSELQAWLNALALKGYSVETGSQEYGIDVARNQNCNRFLDTTAEHLMMLDADMVPIAGTDALLSEPGDLVYCGYSGRSGSTGHYGDEDFGAGCMRVSRAALMSIPRPWFKFATSVHHDQKLSCECNWFARQAERVGIKAKMVGTIGHRMTCISIPQPGTKTGWGITWPEDLYRPAASPASESPHPQDQTDPAPTPELTSH